MGIPSQLHPFQDELLRLMSVLCDYTAIYSNEVCKTDEEEVLYAKLDSVSDQFLPRETSVILSDFKDNTGPGRVSCQL